MVQVYERAKENGAEEIVILTISSAMSGTHESAKKAAELVDIPVHVQDSKSNSMSLEWQVLARGPRQGKRRRCKGNVVCSGTGAGQHGLNDQPGHVGIPA
jgi:hypothetical protein